MIVSIQMWNVINNKITYFYNKQKLPVLTTTNIHVYRHYNSSESVVKLSLINPPSRSSCAILAFSGEVYDAMAFTLTSSGTFSTVIIRLYAFHLRQSLTYILHWTYMKTRPPVKPMATTISLVQNGQSNAPCSTSSVVLSIST